MGRDTHAVVLNHKLNLFPKRFGGERDNRLGSPIAGGVLEQLSQNKDCPLFIGIDHGVIQILRFYPDTTLNQQGTVVFNRLGGDFPQDYLPEETVLFRVFCPCVK